VLEPVTAPVVAPAVTPVAAPTPPPVVAAPGKLSLTTVPPGANVRFDGRPFVAPVVLEGTPGPHVFLIEKAGFRKVEFELVFEAGVELSKEVKLDKLAASPRPPPQPSPKPQPVAAATGPGFLTIDTTPWTQVYLGKRSLGTTPRFKIELPAGKHTLTLVNEEDGRKINATRVVEIVSGQVTRATFELK
jgi:serine/threonine-protein kinase